jgi:hypothetical protein
VKRKIIMQDSAVRAAIEVLKEAVMAVNGDSEIVSFLALIDVRHADGRHSSLAVDCNICPCPKCLTRLRNELFDLMAGALQADGQTPTRH